MASNYPDVSERLSHTFAHWQNYFLAYQAELTLRSQQGIKVTADELRISKLGQQLATMILDNRVEDVRIADWRTSTRFAQKGMPSDILLAFFTAFPAEVMRWNRSSRRVFQLPHSLQSMLASATFPDMRWNDILWPFDSFILALEKPFVVDDPRGHKEKLDTLIISTLPSDGVGRNKRNIFIRLLQRPNVEGERLGFSVTEIHKFNRFLKQGRPLDALKLCEKVNRKCAGLYPTIQGTMAAVLDIDPGSDERVEIEPEDLFAIEQRRNPDGKVRATWENLDDISKSQYELTSVFLKVAVGWMLYLETISSDSTDWKPGRQNKRRLMRGGAPSIITEPERICEIVGKGRIDPSEVTSEPSRRSSKGFVRPHWRRAHYKRPRGAPPSAPKTVRIPPVLVRADLVPLYGIIGGTTTIIIPEE